MLVLNAERGPAICNLNGDAYDDLFVQTPNKVWGLGSSQLSMTNPITINAQTEIVDVAITGFQPTVWETPGKSDIECGDVDGDGYNDLVIGVPGDSPGGRHTAGSVYIVRGTSQITYHQTTTVEVSSQVDTIIEGIDGNSVQVGDSLGRDLAIADVNGDNRADLIMGARYAAGPGNKVEFFGYFPGEVYLWLGRPLNGQTVDLSVETEWIVYGDNHRGHLGGAISTGDIDGDGKVEINLDCGGCNSRGSVFIVEAAQIEGTQSITQAASLSIYPPVEGPYIGVTGITGDLDIDGYDDMIFSALGDDDNELPAKVFLLSYPFRQKVYMPMIVKN
jgi:hypothetical protein